MPLEHLYYAVRIHGLSWIYCQCNLSGYGLPVRAVPIFSRLRMALTTLRVCCTVCAYKSNIVLCPERQKKALDAAARSVTDRSGARSQDARHLDG